MAKHTQGPWEVRNDVNELVVIGHTKSDYSPNPKREDGLWPKKIMLIKATRIGAKRGGNIGYHSFSEEEQANAQLIATTPELLEACKEALIDLELLKDYIPRNRNTIKRLKEVITKAEQQRHLKD